MSGTNHHKKLIQDGPTIILVEPQLGENIGMVARAMANFGLSDLRLVNPRDGWPNEKAKAAARGNKLFSALAAGPNAFLSRVKAPMPKGQRPGGL